MSSRLKSPSTNLQAPPAMEGPKESAVSRLLIAPLTFISFLLSLALIDSHNHSLRTHSHSPTPQPTTILGRIRAFFHHCIYKRTPASPYAYISESSPSQSPSANKEEPWHWHTKQRKMMKAEFSDAYRMRNSVLVVMMAGGLVLAAGVVYGVVAFGGWVRYVWGNWDSMGTMSTPTHLEGQKVVMYGESIRDGL